MTVRIGHIQLQQDIERISKAARIVVIAVHDRFRRSHLVSARTTAEADAFTAAAEALGLADVIGA